ncbi:hybrid sensor histidine kinase/response regulator [Haloglomus salinum]|uniref:hybrid sensor histidine kinase/response regulator n=1 Tax=Haloglomus salinum TaxID=2962673 RepID=UPI0020CA1E50|nr:hybrid sensor histidine kinase/response regulator [Haloglomus salinum]
MSDGLDVLLVEDNPGDARLIRELLDEASTEVLDGRPVAVEHATELADGLERAESSRSDLVLLDLGLPDSVGMSTLERMLDATDDVPVIVLTGRPESDLGVEAVSRGAQDYLVKGEIQVEELGHAVQYAIERARTQRELRHRTQELAILNQLMRHDIKNDISLVVGRGHELTEYVDPRGEELLAELITAANHVLQLTRTVGDTVEAVAHDEQADLEAVDVGRVVEQQVGKARKLYGEDAVAVEGELPGAEVAADDLLSAVVGNLLSNALLYTSDDPDVRVSVVAAEETVTIRVADNGPGVPDEQKELIFGQGTQGVESQGTGIGLYLVDQLVRGYEGDVWVEDNEPTGAVFVVELDRV